MIHMFHNPIHVPEYLGHDSTNIFGAVHLVDLSWPMPCQRWKFGGCRRNQLAVRMSSGSATSYRLTRSRPLSESSNVKDRGELLVDVWKDKLAASDEDTSEHKGDVLARVQFIILTVLVAWSNVHKWTKAAAGTQDSDSITVDAVNVVVEHRSAESFWEQRKYKDCSFRHDRAGSNGHS